jgi:hypothetical protein
MMNKKVLLVAMLMLGLAQVASANLISNGGFETTNPAYDSPALAPAAYDGAYFDGSWDVVPGNYFSDWTPGAGLYEGYATGGVAGEGYPFNMVGANGNNAIVFEPAAPGTADISQTFTSGSGLATFSFDYSGADPAYGGGSSGILSVTIDGNPVTFAAATTIPTVFGSGWLSATSDSFSLAAGSHTLVIGAVVGSGYYGQAGIDNLSISQVPEPSTLALLSAGLVGLLAYAWRKRK